MKRNWGRFTSGLLMLIATAFLSSQAVSADGGICALQGRVTDQAGAAIRGAQVQLLSKNNTQLAQTKTDDAGSFGFEKIAQGSYVVLVEKSGFKPARQLIHITPVQKSISQFRLEIESLRETVTVTAARGEIQPVFDTAASVSITTQDEISRRAATVLPQALKGELGVHVQQTTSGQGSPFIRGLTGQQVVILVDGIRFNNATFRPGANQYLAFIDPSLAEKVEIVRGPGSTQYGSDSLGGTINVLTPAAETRSDSFGWRGNVSTSFSSADLSAGGSASLSGGARNWGFVFGGSGLRTQDVRTGRGIDSHSVVTRLFGISSKTLGNRLQDTGYTQFGLDGKFLYHPASNQTISFEYLHGKQLGLRRYDQLDGGSGNLVSQFDPQVLDFFAARYERIHLGPFDSVSTTFSFNGQRDDRTSQSINNSSGLRSKIIKEYNRTNALGYQVQATTHLGDRHSLTLGAEFYDERILSRRRELSFDKTTGDFSLVAQVRARFPNNSRYQTFGVFAQDIITLLPRRLTGTFGIRYSKFRYRQSPDTNPLNAKGEPTVPLFKTSFGDTTFNAGLVYSINQNINLIANVSRGFRAPNVNDFGSIGLSGLGFEISPEEGARIGGSMRSLDLNRAAENEPIQQLKPEELFNYEAAVRVRFDRFSATVLVFDSEISGLIERRNVILPAGAVGQLIGGQPIVRQDSTGPVFTGLSSSPVLVRANSTRVRLQGIEGTLSFKVRRDLTLNANGSLVRGTDLNKQAPPSLENGIPPATGFFSVRWEPLGRRFWLEGYSNVADAQRRFSENDFQQARIGGIRTRDEIANFFNNGAVARGLVRNGILLATGETLAQVQLRVLGPDPKARIPLYIKNPGFATFNLRGGYRLGERSTLTLILENIFDKNYRAMGSGIDGAGVNAMVRYSLSF